ncbi:MAG: molybdopterin-dependent oxidoreductase, partial [Chloroflexi bacterium]|nr:molybdopterin-dependent oxidoreductase [Chloroflexota bacterium]
TGGWYSEQVWAGLPLADLLEAAGPTSRASSITVTSATGYYRRFSLEEAEGYMLATRVGGAELSRGHGFPVRLIVPRWYGMASVKWLTRIRVLEKPFVGFFQTERYVMEDEAGIDQQISRMEVKSLVSWPEHGTSLPVGRPVAISGMAWSGGGVVRRVDVSLDGGDTWQDAHLDESVLGYSWQQWHVDWTPPAPGHYTILARAADDSGNLQPLETRWNRLGYCVNGTKPVCVTVE